jgi:hypothetical protein
MRHLTGAAWWGQVGYLGGRWPHQEDFPPRVPQLLGIRVYESSGLLAFTDRAGVDAHVTGTEWSRARVGYPYL